VTAGEDALSEVVGVEDGVNEEAIEEFFSTVTAVIDRKVEVLEGSIGDDALVTVDGTGLAVKLKSWTPLGVVKFEDTRLDVRHEGTSREGSELLSSVINSPDIVRLLARRTGFAELGRQKEMVVVVISGVGFTVVDVEVVMVVKMYDLAPVSCFRSKKGILTSRWSRALRLAWLSRRPS